MNLFLIIGELYYIFKNKNGKFCALVFRIIAEPHPKTIFRPAEKKADGWRETNNLKKKWTTTMKYIKLNTTFCLRERILVVCVFVCIEKYFSEKNGGGPFFFFFFFSWSMCLATVHWTESRPWWARTQEEEPAVVGAPVFCLAWLLPFLSLHLLRLLRLRALNMFFFLWRIYGVFSLVNIWALRPSLRADWTVPPHHFYCDPAHTRPFSLFFIF